MTVSFWRRRNVLYRYFDANGRLLYLGSTCNLRRRTSEHRAQAWWFQLVDRTRVQVFPTLDAARVAERTAIQEEAPAFNQLGTGRPNLGKTQAHWTDRDRAMARAFADRWMTAA